MKNLTTEQKEIILYALRNHMHEIEEAFDPNNRQGMTEEEIYKGLDRLWNIYRAWVRLTDTWKMLQNTEITIKN